MELIRLLQDEWDYIIYHSPHFLSSAADKASTHKVTLLNILNWICSSFIFSLYDGPYFTGCTLIYYAKNWCWDSGLLSWLEKRLNNVSTSWKIFSLSLLILIIILIMYIYYILYYIIIYTYYIIYIYYYYTYYIFRGKFY